jgi:hypothetical protein
MRQAFSCRSIPFRVPAPFQLKNSHARFHEGELFDLQKNNSELFFFSGNHLYNEEPLE